MSIPDEAVNAFVPSPGLGKAVAVGTGIRMERFEADAGGAYLWGGKDVEVTDPNSTVVPGEYSHNIIVLSVTATYRI